MVFGSSILTSSAIGARIKITPLDPFPLLIPSHHGRRSLSTLSHLVLVTPFTGFPPPTANMFFLRPLAFTLLPQLSSFVCAALPCALTVETKNGPIQGHLAENRSDVTEFLGIPFAQPPVGDLRFAAPEAYERRGLHVADKFVGIDSTYRSWSRD